MNNWLIWVREQLPEYIGFSLDENKQKEMAKDLYHAMQCILDMDFESRGGRPSSEEKVDYRKLYEAEKAKNIELILQRDIYRKDVAKRYNIDPKYVDVDSFHRLVVIDK